MLLDRTTLSTALARAARIASSRATLPVLANVRLWVNEPDTLTIQSTDLERGLSQEIECECGYLDRIDTTVNAKAIAEVANAMTCEKLRITINEAGTRVTITGDKASIELPTIPASEFPPFATMPPGYAEIDPAALLAAAARVMVAASTEEARPVLQGVNCDGETMTATDSFRIHIAPFATGKAIIPARTMAEAVKLFAKSDYLKVASANGQWFVSDGETTLISQLIEGNFPDWKAIVPKEHKATVEAQVQPLLAALRRVQIIQPANNVIKLTFADNAITITGSSEETGTAEDVVDAVVTGAPPAVAVNIRFFVQALEATRRNPVRLHINSAVTPLVVEDGSGWKAIVMPMHLG